MIKIFGVGNILRSDDGVGVKVIENIKRELELNTNVEVIFGEKKCMKSLKYIKEEDFVIIVDGTCFDFKTGYVSKLSFVECDDFIIESMDVNKDSLLKILRREHSAVKGYLIGVEINKLENSINLSKEIDKQFKSICNRVLDKIRGLIKVNIGSIN